MFPLVQRHGLDSYLSSSHEWYSFVFILPLIIAGGASRVLSMGSIDSYFLDNNETNIDARTTMSSATNACNIINQRPIREMKHFWFHMHEGNRSMTKIDSAHVLTFVERERETIKFMTISPNQNHLRRMSESNADEVKGKRERENGGKTNLFASPILSFF